MTEDKHVKGEEIDDSLYSRQRYVLGDEAMKKMAKSNVFLSGMGGVGVEIAKNIALAGIRTLTLHDTKPTTQLDLASQFYLSENDIGKNRVNTTATKISELNPYVKVKVSTVSLEKVELSYFDEFKCVILTDANIDTLLRVNEYCHSKNICFISAEVRGVFTWSFIDFGRKFEVLDTNGEQIKQILISNITKANPGVVSCIEHHLHDLQTGDYVEFSEIKGCTELNQGRYQVTVLTPSTFSICDTSNMPEFIPGSGYANDVKVPAYLDFESLSDSLMSPGELMVCDFGKFSNPEQIFVAIKGLYQFEKLYDRLPDPWNEKEAKEFFEMAKEFNENNIELDEKIIKSLAYTAQGTLAPLSAFIGGIVGQEALKAISGKFTPIKQWLLLDAMEVLPKDCFSLEFNRDQCKAKNDRLDGLRICVGESTIEKISSTKLFMVGSGAIGCELLKNFALLNVGDKNFNGCLTITDNDLIEKSNLNRQFLFRPHDIQQPKSTTAARVAKEMNANLNIIAHLEKVGAQSEEKYNSEFYQSLDIIVNALDNVEARLYMDTRAVANQKPLLESGTLGTKGHVQVVVPFLTESYGSSKDPQSKDIPYCTLKFFPGNMEHCIVWAREMAFEDFFVANASNVRRYSEEEQIIEKLKTEDQDVMRILPSVASMLKDRPKSFADCVSFARLNFETFFKNNILQLLKKFPLDHKMNDGSFFWASPKRPPTPIDFDLDDPTHFSFIYNFALLWAQVWIINDIVHSKEEIRMILENVHIPTFVPKDDVVIETDENAKKKDKDENVSDDIMKNFRDLAINVFLSDANLKICPIEFEKDDDTNHHIDFITAAANLRARNYAIKEIGRLEIKRIAGNITPAIATTTSAVSGLVSLELMKVRLSLPFDKYKNTFLNLAIPFFSMSEPGEAEKTVISNDVSFTLWDIWDVYGHSDFTLQNLFDYFLQKYKLKVTGVFQGSAMIWIPGLPMLQRKLPKPLTEIFQNPDKKEFITIGLTFSTENNEPVKTAPPIRYYFSNPSSSDKVTGEKRKKKEKEGKEKKKKFKIEQVKIQAFRRRKIEEKEK